MKKENYYYYYYYYVHKVNTAKNTSRSFNATYFDL